MMALPSFNFWTLFPPARLRGVGTPMVEGIHAFILRLGYISGLPLAVIVRQLTKEVGGSVSFSSTEPAFDRTIAALEKLTGSICLAHGSFRWVRDIVSHYWLSTFALRRRWCPICYLDWDKESWEPLLWTVDLVRACPIHECALEESCYLCGTPQRPMTPYARRRSCVKCRQPLGHAAPFAATTQYEKWVDQQVRDVIELCATPGQTPPASNTVTVFLRELRQSAWAMPVIPAGLGDILGTTRSNLRASKRIRFRTLVNLCSLQAVPVREMLLNPRGAASAPLLNLWESFTPLALSYGFQHKKAHAFAVSLRRLLRNHKGTCLPPIQQVLRATQLTCCQAQDLKPHIYAQYKAAYASQGHSANQIRARWNLRVAMRLLQSRGNDKTVRSGRPKTRGLAVAIAKQANTSLDSAREALYAAHQVCRILLKANVLLVRSHPPALEDPAWTRGFWQPSND
jgi:hypothetical protein